MRFMPHVRSLLGLRFGRLVVISQSPSHNGRARWKCVCDCGGTREAVLSANLISGTSSSCGCGAIANGNHIRDLTGQRFGRLIVVGLGVGRSGNNVRWDCICDCGRKKTGIAGGSLLSGMVKSCGCLWKDTVLQRFSRASTKHGQWNTPAYRSWLSMMHRCASPKNGNYKYYGARGIAVCDRWHLFENFLADMGIRPEGKTLDRINNDGNYEPGNCRWATPKEQRQNQRPRKS